MSIATDEARKESHRRCLEGCVGPAQFAFQDGYVAGRTAVARTLEVEEAAYALWKTEVNMMGLMNLTEDEYTHAWGKLSKQQRDMYRSKALVVLDAARKVVTE